jgi:hypothetical protein
MKILYGKALQKFWEHHGKMNWSALEVLTLSQLLTFGQSKR